MNINLNTLLPQKYPFLMIDAIVSFEKGKGLSAVKNVTGNEWMFSDQLNVGTIFPNTLLIEAAAQTAIAFCRLEVGVVETETQRFYLGKTDAEFFEPVLIGDQVIFKTSRYKIMKTGGFITVEALVNDKVIAKIKIYSVRT